MGCTPWRRLPRTIPPCSTRTTRYRDCGPDAPARPALDARAAANGTGLLVHGYDDSKTAVWADPQTGASPHVWGRSLGWYTMALVDTLEILPPKTYPSEWALLRARFRQPRGCAAHGRGPASGAWWQLLDQPGAAGELHRVERSAMFVYSLPQGPRAYNYITDTFVVKTQRDPGVQRTVSVCSLNSTASYEYYVGCSL
ncbi:hypothetical protein B0H14DRAFT_3715396 [Mycena olivaceomarginata]|nr:hypothetical protein B0H14DRAFT_3715396 [Mycena olivaceomarginata]